MDCLECGGTYTAKSGVYSLVDPYVGQIILEGVLYYQCDKCETILYSEEMARTIESERNKRIHRVLDRYPIGDFASAAQTASMLGISRQALHKNRRINHGFIYQTKLGPITLYLKQSVQQYKRTGDGRFPLYPHRRSSRLEYAEHTMPSRIPAVYEVSQVRAKRVRPFVEHERVDAKEYSYVS